MEGFLITEEKLSAQIKDRIKTLKISHDELSIQTEIPIATLKRIIKRPYHARFGNLSKLCLEIGFKLCVG
ncbi:hypothetical protein [Rosenbergiella metrosideri]|uniref:hypothetical protein n=1 Tax=Rosenbergiella metrosideri TaxID=2921185 RepID=UPI001F4F8678|nr:hypothetical protein [Rosenbergiella metrosideri]